MSSIERLGVWTTMAFLALGFTVWLTVDNYRNWQAVRAAVQHRRLRAWGPHWWIALADLVGSFVMIGVWISIATVGVLGFYPPLVEYRSWGQLVAVTLLSMQQVWHLIARKRVQGAA